MALNVRFLLDKTEKSIYNTTMNKMLISSHIQARSTSWQPEFYPNCDKARSIVSGVCEM
jgi:hypothetical protein